MKILVIAAHPDDEVLGCGATMARHAGSGDDVYVAILGEGISSRHGRRDDASSEALAKLKADANIAAAKLGAKPVLFGNLPDNRFDQVALLDVVKQVEAWLDEVRPDVIYTHHPGDLNVDHGITFRAVLTATRPGVSPVPVRELYAFEVPSSTDWAFQRIEPAFRPTVFVDVTATIDAKVAAMECYESERRVAPHPRSPEILRATATRWGSVAGIKSAEAFELIRLLKV